MLLNIELPPLIACFMLLSVDVFKMQIMPLNDINPGK